MYPLTPITKLITMISVTLIAIAAGIALMGFGAGPVVFVPVQVAIMLYGLELVPYLINVQRIEALKKALKQDFDPDEVDWTFKRETTGPVEVSATFPYGEFETKSGCLTPGCTLPLPHGACSQQEESNG